MTRKIIRKHYTSKSGDNGAVRFLSRNVFVDGLSRGLAVVEINHDGTTVVSPYEYETAATSWTDSKIEVRTDVVPNLVRFVDINK